MIPNVRPMAIGLDTLDGADERVLVSGPTFGLVTVRLVFASGGVDDGSTSGLSYAALELAELGTTRMSRDAFHAALERRGAELSTGVGRVSSVVEVSVLEPWLEEALELVGDALLLASDDRRELRTLRDEVTDGALQEVESPPGAVGRYLGKALWPRGIWGKPIDGVEADRTAWTRAAIRDRRAAIVAAPCVVGVACDDPARVWPKVAALHRRLREATGPSRRTKRREPPAIAWGEGHVIRFRDAQQSALTVVSPGPAPSSEAWAAVRLHQTAFGAGFASPLLRAVRSEAGLSYEVDWSLVPERGRSLHMFRVAPEARRLPEALRVAERTWAEWHDRRMDDSALALAKALCNGNHLASLETAQQRLSAAMRLRALDLPVERLWALPARIAELTADDVQTASAAYGWSQPHRLFVAAMDDGVANPSWEEHGSSLPVRGARLGSVL